MNPTIGYHLAQAHQADLRHQAQRDTLARAARRAERAERRLRRAARQARRQRTQLQAQTAIDR